MTTSLKYELPTAFASTLPLHIQLQTDPFSVERFIGISLDKQIVLTGACARERSSSGVFVRSLININTKYVFPGMQIDMLRTKHMQKFQLEYEPYSMLFPGRMRKIGHEQGVPIVSTV